MERIHTPWYKAFELPFVLLLALALLLLFFKLIGYVLPLLFASILALLMEPMVRFLSTAKGEDNKTIRRGLPRKVAVVVTMFLLLSILVLALSLLIGGITDELIDLYDRLPQVLPMLGERISGIVDGLKQKASFLSPPTLDALTQAFNAVGQRLMAELGNAATVLIGTAARFPSFILFIIVMVLSTYFIAGERERMIASIENHIPKNWLSVAFRLYNTLLKALWGWIRAQFLIMICMFVLLFIGFMLLRIPYALLIAACIAAVDALPVLGSGLILLPWSICQIFLGAQGVGLGLLILYLSAIGARQTLEPRLVGARFGLHPLVTMASMYAGLRITGFCGLLLGPLFALILTSVAKAYLNGRTYREVIGRKNRQENAS